jgi:3D (Asp-Asp-Asp) domain-containing protein
VLGQAQTRRRLLAVALTAVVGAAVPAAGVSDPGSSAASLRAENDRLAAESRAAVLDLYSLDASLLAANQRLEALRADMSRLRVERGRLVHARQLARRGIVVSQRQLAARLCQLYEQGDVSPIEVVLGARSLTDALTQLDDVDRVASLNDAVIAQLRSAKIHLASVSRALTSRSTRLQAAMRAAAATEASLAATKVERTAFIASLQRRRDLNAAEIAQLEAQAQAAEARAQSLSGGTTPAATEVRFVSPPPASSAPVAVAGRTLTVTITGYALPGRTATGIPVGWGVAAVDPSVIPLGTHISVPGYGDAVAADVGGAIVGSRVDLWFPTVAQASQWGLRTVTISLH